MLIKILRKLKCKKGLTLMELIVGLIMFSMISVAVSMLLAPTLFAYMRANDFAEYNGLLDNIANQMINDMSQAIEPLMAEGDPTLEDEVIIITRTRNVHYQVNGGILQMAVRLDDAGLPVFDDVFTADFYNRKEVSFTVEPDEEAAGVFEAYILTITLTGTDGNRSGNEGFTIEREYAVRPLMLQGMIKEDD